MSFDPTQLTVKQARAKLSGLGLAELEAVLAAEIDGKHRSSLMAEVGRAIDALKTEEEAEASLVAPEPEASPARVLSGIEWFRLPREVRRCWARQPDGTYLEL